MPPLILGRRQKVRPKKGGERVWRHCPECDQDAMFLEAEVDTTYTAFFAVELFSLEDETYVCSACQEQVDLDATSAPRAPEPTSSVPLR